MAQLSTDTLVYSQIISKVQEFLTRYSKNNFVSAKDFDEKYKKLLTEIEQSVGIPTAELNFFHKGEIPSSSKLNTIAKNISTDINIVGNQFDSLVANYINYFNKVSNEIESEKQFLSRIKSKISVLDMYSESGATNLSYFGDSLNNLDNIDAAKIKPGLIPNVEGGFVSLAKKQLRKTMTKVSIINQNYNEQQNKTISFADVSNGLSGNHFLYYEDAEKGNPFIYEKDSSVIRTNVAALTDESPATYFEYESIKVVQPISELQKYEFQYRIASSNSGDSLIDWGLFNTSNTLKLTLMLQSGSGSLVDVNYISIVPFFGYDRIHNIKNIKISSVKLYNEKDNKIYTLFENENIYIGSDVVAPNLSSKNKYFYNKGILKFETVKANKIFITFEQASHTDVTIKHAFWTPYETSELANTPLTSTPWKAQARFNPYAIVSGQPGYKSEDVSWDMSTVVPQISKPTEYKSSSQIIRPAIIKYSQLQNTNVERLKHVTSNGDIYYHYTTKDNLNGCNFRIFTKDKQQATKDNSNGSINVLKTRTLEDLAPDNLSGRIPILIEGSENLSETTANLKQKIVSCSTSSSVTTFVTEKTHGLAVNDYVYINVSADLVDQDNKKTKLSPIVRKKYKVTSVNVNDKSFSVSTTASNFVSVNLSGSFYYLYQGNFTDANVLVETSPETDSRLEQKSLFLRRNFEYLKAKRAAIGIRDIYVGSEKYVDTCEIVSKPYYIYGSLQMLSLNVDEHLPVERDANGEIIGKTNIDYYVSVDNGSKWLEISPIQRSYEGKKEVLAFNQNLSDNQSVPQIKYYNYPDVPQNISSIIFKAVLKKDRTANCTPILYSYKFGVKVI